MKKQKTWRKNNYKRRVQGWSSAFREYTVKEESFLHSLEQAASGIGLYVNSDKTECMHFKQDRVMSILKCKPMKLVEQWRYLIYW